PAGPGDGDRAGPRIAALIVCPAKRQSRKLRGLLRKVGVVRAHPLEQAVEARQLHARDRRLDLGGAEVPAGEAWQPGAAAHRAGAVVHVDRELVEVVAVGDHHAAFAGRDDLVELEAERTGVAERPEPLPPVARTGGLT